MPRFLAFVLVTAVVVFAALSQYESTKGFVTPFFGALITFSIFWSNRYQSKRQVVLDLQKEYFSADFAKSRVKAERFFTQYNDVDWSTTNPYRLLDPKNNRPGYAAVVRYWHRVAILYRTNQLDRELAHELLARDLGFWFGRFIEQMKHRKGMYTLDDLIWLVDQFKIQTSGKRFSEGYADGVSRRTSSGPRPKLWVRGARRWTKTGSSPIE